MKFKRILMAVLSLLQILDYALIGVLVRALEGGTISTGFFGGIQALMGLTIIANIFIVYSYAEDTGRNAGLWGLGAFLFHFFIPILLAVLPVPKEETPSMAHLSPDEPKIKKTLLKQLLKTQPEATQKQVGQAMASVPCNFEFVVAVKIPKMQKHMDNANQKGFMVWCNEDGNLAVMYGAGVVGQDNFTDHMQWLNKIRVIDQPAMVHFVTSDGEKVIEIS